MSVKSTVRSAGRWLGAGVGLAAGAYASYVAYAWLTYGHARPAATAEDRDSLLDRFIPTYEVAERHQIEVNAPAATTFEAATHLDLLASPVSRAIFRGRELIMGSQGRPVAARGSFLEQMTAIGWGMLAEVPGREVVMGAVTQPWRADVVFRPLRPEDFAAFNEPDYVKIVWTLRADATGASTSVFRTETRVATTDAGARARFRRYWALASPGIILIRWLSLGPLKADAERRARAQAADESFERDEWGSLDA